MTVYIIVNDVTAFFAADVIGQSAEPGDIVAGKEPQPVLTGEAFTVHNLGLDISVFFRTKQCIPSSGTAGSPVKI